MCRSELLLRDQEIALKLPRYHMLPEATLMSHGSRDQDIAPRPLQDVASRGPLSKYTQTVLNVTMKLNFRVHILRGRASRGQTPKLHSPRLYFDIERIKIFKRIRSKIWQITEPAERSCIRVSRSWVRVPNPAWPGSAHARACGKEAHSPTLIIIDHIGVSIITLNLFLIYPM